MLGTIVLSAFLAHTGWQWMAERRTELIQYDFRVPVMDVGFAAVAFSVPSLAPTSPPHAGPVPWAAVQFRHNHSRSVYTWRDDPQEFTPGRLDFLFYTSDAASVSRAFALWTPDLPASVLAAAGLERDDSQVASDHLVLVADFEFRRLAGRGESVGRATPCRRNQTHHTFTTAC